jgi:2-phosphosulfolactate phosphatase
MKIDVVLLPGQQFTPERSVCVIVDVLRASSSIATILSRGCPEVVPAATVDEARRLGASLPGHILCGEAGGLRPEGFAYGNSPVEFSRLDLAGRPVILATSNGTRVLTAVAERAPAVLVGCLLNRTAAARAAIDIATRDGLDIAVVCSAAHGGSTFVLEDALGAGAIAAAALDISPDVIPSDSARFARDAFTVASRDVTVAVRAAYHAQELADIGLGEDVAYCARVDISDIAPVLHIDADGLSLRPN